MTVEHSEHQEGEPRVVVRDRRRVDPETGEVRPPAPAGEEPGAGPVAQEGGRHAATESTETAEPTAEDRAAEETAALRAELAERTADLQRLSAEYANYRKRVERDREAVIAGAKAQVVTDLLGVLDDLERAEAHGDLTGAFKAVADKLGAALTKAGLEPFGTENEPFDPSVHEAVQHSTSPEVSGPTVTLVMRRGYRFGDRVVRPALVGVTDHEPAAQVVEPDSGDRGEG
ncbi:nucleotide exchange factor GrpE [Allokutzneria sp. A3M-2-11 16]|uniref:nucleotide exchange factor GrpE n=1 Tax=Allokutzneria sp. A3M-2-11 16 TaxID=2962043 RepID=UPI0020B6A511|nr:nucleotide exchange factor GrpE [Allokutzneria sp. A3M-2-11 16]MCP3799249.1 nucleotide exchange factor GrpE [Allokutzneria sp. A3M-2-11 16]